MQCSLLTRIWNFRRVSRVWCSYSAVVSESLFPSVQSSALTLCLLWPVLTLCSVSGTQAHQLWGSWAGCLCSFNKICPEPMAELYFAILDIDLQIKSVFNFFVLLLDWVLIFHSFFFFISNLWVYTIHFSFWFMFFISTMSIWFFYSFLLLAFTICSLFEYSLNIISFNFLNVFIHFSFIFWSLCLKSNIWAHSMPISNGCLFS